MGTYNSFSTIVMDGVAVDGVEEFISRSKQFSYMDMINCSSLLQRTKVR